MIESFIERVPTREFPRRSRVWKQMRRSGWSLTVLLAPDRKSVVAVGFLAADAVPEPGQLALAGMGTV